MEKEVFRGVGTALVTPFKDGKIDKEALALLIERQINAGIDALIIAGTTGEASTIGKAERRELYITARELVGDRCKLIFGVGTNNTESTLEFIRIAEETGCDGLLVVTPYYNKGTREGVFKHYETIAKSTVLPIILYNVPSRTGIDMPISTVLRLSDYDNIVGIKEAKGDRARLAELVASTNLAVYTGCDDEMLEVLRLGGAGVISVVSNVCPRAVAEMYRAFWRGEDGAASAMMRGLLPLIRSLFIETNPAPVKYALSHLGLCREEMRLPMYPIGKDERRVVEGTLEELREYSPWDY